MTKTPEDLLHDGPPPEWRTTRHCPKCNAVDLVVEYDDALAGGWCTTSCASCGRELRVDRLDKPVWEDAEWAASGLNQ